MLDSAAKTRLGVSDDGEHRDIGAARNCRWRVRGPSATYVLDVGILDDAGIDDIPNQIKVEKLADIGKHQAVQSREAGGRGTCAIVLGITGSSRVDTNVGASGDTAKACELVMELAQQVEPKLP